MYIFLILIPLSSFSQKYDSLLMTTLDEVILSDIRNDKGLPGLTKRIQLLLAIHIRIVSGIYLTDKQEFSHLTGKILRRMFGFQLGDLVADRLLVSEAYVFFRMVYHSHHRMEHPNLTNLVFLTFRK